MRRLMFKAAFVAVGAAIALASLNPEGGVGSLDKLFHFSAYALWAFVAGHASRHAGVRGALIAVILVIGVMVEVVQPLYGREGSVYDALANTLGVIAGMLAAGVSRARRWPEAPGVVLTAIAGALGAAVTAYTVVPLVTLPMLATWDCSQSVLTGDEIGGGRAWRGEVVCARLTAGDASLRPSGSAVPVCGQAGRPAGAAAMIELGSRSANGTPTRADRWQNDETAAFCAAAQTAQALVLEAWVRSDAGAQYGPARIVTFSDSAFARNITLGQEGSAFDLRLRSRATGRNGELLPVMSRAGSVVPGTVQHVVADYRDGAVSLLIDGTRQAGPVALWYSPRVLFDRASRFGVLIGGAGITGILLFAGVAAWLGRRSQPVRSSKMSA